MGKKFAPSCEKIIKGVKKSNKSRPKSKRVNPFAIALSNKKCRTDQTKRRK